MPGLNLFIGSLSSILKISLSNARVFFQYLERYWKIPEGFLNLFTSITCQYLGMLHTFGQIMIVTFHPYGNHGIHLGIQSHELEQATLT